MTMLTLIRHAHAQAAITGVVAGPKGDTGLSDLGRRQAAALRDRLLALGFTTDVVLTSILPRAVETAQILAPVLGSAEAEQDCDLCELHPGDADGIPWDEYRTRYNVVPYETPDEPFSPGGESLRELEARASRVLADVTTRHPDERVTIVSHGGLIERGVPAAPRRAAFRAARVLARAHAHVDDHLDDERRARGSLATRALQRRRPPRGTPSGVMMCP